MADLRKDTIAFLKEQKRMCKHTSCEECNLYNKDGLECGIHCANNDAFLDKYVSTVQKWHDEHLPKTYKQDFLEKFPNAATNENECPRFCRGHIYGDCNCWSRTSCDQCWNEFVSDDV